MAAFFCLCAVSGELDVQGVIDLKDIFNRSRACLRRTRWRTARTARHVVLRARGEGLARGEQIRELLILKTPVEVAAIGKSMQQRRHPPGEPLTFPHSRERTSRVAFEARIVALLVVVDQRVVEIVDIGGGALRPRATVGGRMCAASSAREQRTESIGSTTRERKGAMLFSIDGPVIIAAATSCGSRRVNSSKNCSLREIIPALENAADRVARRAGAIRNNQIRGRSGHGCLAGHVPLVELTDDF